VGVVSGLVTSVVVFIGVIIWRSVLKPKLEEIAYKGVDISGRWELSPLSEGELEWGQFEALELNQSAHRIAGIATLVAREGGASSPLTLVVEGEICDRFVFAKMSSPLKQRVARVVFLAEVIGDGSTLKGQTTLYNIEDSTISSGAMLYRRMDRSTVA
jgi:hypothetical protein